MANLQPVYGTAATLTITLNSLGNGSSATSNIITNTAYLDALIFAQITSAAGALATGLVEVYVQGSTDGTTFDNTSNDKWIGSMTLSAAGSQVITRIMPVAASFGGSMPPYWRVRVRNSTGAALHTSGHSASYRGISAQTV